MQRTMNRKTFRMTVTALLMALQIVMTFTGIGYIPIGPLKLTLLTLPVAIGAVVCGPFTGLVLGATFGLTSFATALLGMDALGALLLSFGWKYALFLAIVCIVPRILCGWLPALLHEKWKTKNETLSAAACCALVAIINTALFLGAFWLFFAGDLQSGALGFTVSSLWVLFVTWAGVNALIEVGVNLVLGTAIVKALSPVVKKLS
ncbi:MAG: ECF transporter S component [Clostridia bacterium]|nr:ECF transporter S component [Clostridia bacterium]